MSISKTEKPWGYEEVLQQNKFYVVKKLFMKKDHRCSLQYHRFKDETFIVLEGRLRLYYGIDKTNLITKDLNPGDYFHIPITTIHRMEAINDCIYIECSTNNLDDVVRIEDEYGRV